MPTLRHIAKDIRLSTLAMHHRAHAGHIGSALSCIELLVACHFDMMRAGDELVLSKGHAASALYALLAHKGLISQAQLSTFHHDDTLLAAHTPPGKLPSIRFGTGSLGHGMSLAAGIALGSRLAGRNERAFCVVSEGDLNEGSTWEAGLFARQQQLGNLLVLADLNGLQGFGKTPDVIDLEPLDAKWGAFGFQVETCDGHDVEAIGALGQRMFAENNSQPKIILARTVKGKGVSFMENELRWHYVPMTDEQYQRAVDEVSSH